LLRLPISAIRRWTLPAEPGCVSNWYLKGFLGITSYDLDGISSATFKEGSGFGGLGLGYSTAGYAST
jgi:hypothetical protein